MSVHCDVILRGSATPGQLAAVGAGLWRWCRLTAGNTGVYQHLDSQALADLIAGRMPARGLHFRVLDEASQDRQATLDSLHRELPADGIEDLVVEGTSWNYGGPVRTAVTMN